MEVAKRIGTAARREELGSEATKELAGRQLRAEVAQISGCSIREEVAERRGASAKRSLTEEVAQQRKAPIHSFIHPSLHSLVH